jgi:hypothetical protein
MSSPAHHIGFRIARSGVVNVGLPLRTSFAAAHYGMAQYIDRVRKSPQRRLMHFSIERGSEKIDKFVRIAFDPQARPTGPECRWQLRWEPHSDEYPSFKGTLRLLKMSPYDSFLWIDGRGTAVRGAFPDAGYIAASTARMILERIRRAIESESIDADITGGEL